jgi:hypothetical protein
MDLALRTETFGNQSHAWLGSAFGTQSTKTCTLAVAAFTEADHYANGFFPDGLALAMATSGTYSGKVVPLAARPTEAQTVTITGTPTGGTFTLTFDGETTAGIAYNAAASAVTSALEALSNIDAGSVVTTGGPGPGTPYVVTFSGTQFAGTNVPQMTASAASLTGGTSPAVAVTTTTAGGSGSTTNSDVLWGFLYMPVTVPTGATNVVGPALLTGQIIASKLPVAITAAQKATNPHFVWL